MALSVVYFWITHRLGRPHYVWNEYLYSVLEEVEARVAVYVIVCVVVLWSLGWYWKEGRRWNPVPAYSLLFSKSTKRASRLNVHIRQTNRYQHMYCRRVWNLIQACDAQSSNEKVYISTLLAQRLKIFKWKFTTPSYPLLRYRGSKLPYLFAFLCSDVTSK